MAQKILYQDIVPYETPSWLSALRGPASGMIEIPITVHWGPRHVFDLDDTGQRRAAYRAIVREGTPEVQEALLNVRLLRQLWPELVLPVRCRTLWETRFPELFA
ncbi:transcriptional regulator [Rathayibacter soli]|uniref:transcriptional regulator n=1 Tax=Rathayibacter soli TaxID=3144168 RepID=UPI0027E535EC|nr:transcriptional regulator [Glaciibacter superstes]